MALQVWGDKVVFDAIRELMKPPEPSIEEHLSGQRPMSHFEKSLAAMEVEVIHANSPQVEGRVERKLFLSKRQRR